tara:strand:- start:148 stop:444 length:297 start_codon:yes stop_codon:yes gene_type:complete
MLDYKEQGWYFRNGYRYKEPKLSHHQWKVRTFCQKKDYKTFVLVSKEILEKIRYEPEVVGFSVLASFTSPYPIFSVALNTDKIDRLLKKYEVDCVWYK